ncbi:family 16 glycoside hydrolase [Rubripirellula reticaptiva]|uniref:Beta-galactosidase n=1 Tax=Rubripirellula reticaptiva TaxID=2528013 RepID=A0A5C6F4Z9_9BACT|nr:family 16 glycoside hydrolase [Rubripirellula reticaptiva]TWU55590.1 Beta-galactosidase [Rubripirellula reticaptiva]
MKSQLHTVRTIALALVAAIGLFAGGSVRGDAAKAMTESVGEETSFNADWTFHNGEADVAEAVDFDDSVWRSLNLSHDWAIEGPFDVKYNAHCGGLPFHGTGWYRKTFQVPAYAKGKVAAITFDGAMYNAHVWVNGTFVGNRPFGYIEFQYDISKHLRYGKENIISVRLKTEDLSSRWYPGARLYRNVWLEYKNPLHLAHWGTFVSTPIVQEDRPTVAVETAIVQYPNADVWTDAKLAAKEFPGFDFIGEYVKDGQAVQVTPSGDKFYLSIYQGGLPGSGWDHSPIAHQWENLDGMATRLQGWNKIDRSETVVGKKPSEDATVLFDGSNVDAWNNGKIENGVLKAGAVTKQKYRDFTLYLEFQIPLKPQPPISHPHRGNSGVFAVGAYEVQISDTFGLDHDPQAWEGIDMLKPVNTWSGSIYGIRSADQNMCLPPLTWQSMEIDFRAARFKDGVKTADAVISVIHNGVKVHDHVSLPEGTGGGPSGPRDEVAEGPIYLQNHGNPNRFRNIWIVSR